MTPKNYGLQGRHPDHSTTPAGPRVVKAKRSPGMFVCGKCLKKCNQGRAIQEALKTALADQAKGHGRRPAKLVKTKCIGLCPKQAVVAANGAALIRGEVLLLKSAEHAAMAVGFGLDKASP